MLLAEDQPPLRPKDRSCVELAEAVAAANAELASIMSDWGGDVERHDDAFFDDYSDRLLEASAERCNAAREDALALHE